MEQMMQGTIAEKAPPQTVLLNFRAKPEDAAELYRLLYGVLGALQEKNDAAQPELGGKA